MRSQPPRHSWNAVCFPVSAHVRGSAPVGPLHPRILLRINTKLLQEMLRRTHIAQGNYGFIESSATKLLADKMRPELVSPLRWERGHTMQLAYKGAEPKGSAVQGECHAGNNQWRVENGSITDLVQRARCASFFTQHLMPGCAPLCLRNGSDSFER
jgi:hypothetical protein